MSSHKRPHDAPHTPTPGSTKKPRAEKDVKPELPLHPDRATPSSVMGLEHAARLLSAPECRHILENLLSDKEARLAVARLVGSSSSSGSDAAAKPPRRVAQYVAAKYDALFAAQPDQVVSFDGIVNAINTGLRQIWNWDSSASKPPSRKPPSAQEVATNIKAIHAAAVYPASLGTRLNALKAILEINQFLIRNSFLREAEDRKEIAACFPTLGTAVFEICKDLTAQERLIAMGMHFPSDLGGQPNQHQHQQQQQQQQRAGANQANNGFSLSQMSNQSQSSGARASLVGETLEVELRAQAKSFYKFGIFKGIVDAYEMMMESKKGTATTLQAIAITISDEESDDCQLIGEEQEEGIGTHDGEVPESQ
ncbi:hypothetical protein QBC42DRAFT_313591 [Cladorrhinum samala]|uniref:Uncharacterized protein n=1 Tax=Cladorrhinum samala TaxID=585594 RepID=A0AAV9HYZ0_9PEZI|nr:hypothetical protein QBC42DRAFT_313591 [Cladorrhinum samala]